MMNTIDSDNCQSSARRCTSKKRAFSADATASSSASPRPQKRSYTHSRPPLPLAPSTTAGSSLFANDIVLLARARAQLASASGALPPATELARRPPLAPEPPRAPEPPLPEAPLEYIWTPPTIGVARPQSAVKALALVTERCERRHEIEIAIKRQRKSHPKWCRRRPRMQHAVVETSAAGDGDGAVVGVVERCVPRQPAELAESRSTNAPESLRKLADFLRALQLSAEQMAAYGYTERYCGSRIWCARGIRARAECCAVADCAAAPFRRALCKAHDCVHERLVCDAVRAEAELAAAAADDAAQ